MDVAKRIDRMVWRVRRAEEVGLIDPEQAEERISSLRQLEELHSSAVMIGDWNQATRLTGMVGVADSDTAQIVRWAGVN